MPHTYNKKGEFEKVQNSADDVNISEEAQNLYEQVLDEEVEQAENQTEQAEEKAFSQADAQKEIEELKLRTLAEMDNFKKRLMREKEEQAKFAAENVLLDIIPALDNLDLALQYSSNEACKDILIGIQMTRKLLLDSLKNHGLNTISDEKVPFNPEIHEAVSQEESEELEANYIVKVLQKGYMLKDRLLRPAKVVVSK